MPDQDQDQNDLCLTSIFALETAALSEAVTIIPEESSFTDGAEGESGTGVLLYETNGLQIMKINDKIMIFGLYLGQSCSLDC